MTRNGLPLLVASLSFAALSGCSGGGSSAPGSASPITQTYGSLTTRIVGTAQAPVVSAGYYATVTAVAGALISQIE